MRRSVLCLMTAAVLLGSVPPVSEIMPTARFDANFLNFPRGWTVSTGKGISVAVIEPAAVEGGSGGTAARIKRLAPDARVERTSLADFLGAGPLLPEKTAPKAPAPDVVLLMTQPLPADRAAALRSIERLSDRGASVVIPAWFGPMENAADDDPRIVFVREASARGAVIVGAHGRAYQIGNLEFWKKMPVDTYALHEGIDGDEYSGPDALLDRPLESPAPYAAAAVALLKSVETGLPPALVKEKLREGGRRVIWTRIRFAGEDGIVRDWVLPAMSRAAFDVRLRAWGEPKPEVGERFAASSLDVSLLLGLPPLAGGEDRKSVV